MAYPVRSASPALLTNPLSQGFAWRVRACLARGLDGSRPTPSDALQGMRLCQHILIAWCDVFIER